MHELDLLQSIYHNASLTNSITIGPGDDMGEIIIGNERILSAVDHLIIGRHVTAETPPESIGRKAIARCFSDISAMGATPVGSLMTACLPNDISNTWCENVFRGANTIATEWGGPIFGGDIAVSDGPAVFTVTALAIPPTQGAILRTGAKAGDHVCVTGELGNSISGHHLTFTPRIEEAKELISLLGTSLHSMIDISDGLGQDASHLASDKLQLIIDTATLPLRSGADIESAISDGEDYELLFTCSEIPPSHLATVIGTVSTYSKNKETRGKEKVITTDGRDISNCGWVHE